jgi:hypothetical protein
METLLTDYLRYLLNTVQTDIQQFDHWWMWAPFLIPAICWMVLILLKIMLLTCPLWLPIRMALNVRGLLYYTGKRTKKKEKDAE